MTNKKFVAENASGNVDDFAGIRCEWKTVNVLELEKECVRIQVHYSSINYKDALAVTGKGKILRALPLVPGIDASGVVLESKTPEFKIGDEVLVTGCGLGEQRDGGYSQIIDVPSSWIIHKPKNVSLTDAMILGTAGFTAGLALHQLHLNGLKKSEKPVLVTGASGGVGSLAIMMLHSLGYTTEAWTRKESEVAYLKSIGANIVTTIKDLDTKTRPLESAVWSAAIDNVGGDVLSYIIPRIEPQGSVATIGMAKSMELKTNVFPFILRGVNILGVSSTTCPRLLREKVWSEINALKVDWQKCLKSTLGGRDIQLYCQKMIDGQISGRAIVDARTF
jgi:acrylyl-CoA reductase (NADPH)